MEGKRLLRSVRLRNLLSYGPESESIELQQLNVLIGPNGSGKSNFIAGIGLLHAAARDFAQAIRDGGGVDQWLWKGAKGIPAAEMDVILNWPGGEMPLRYHLEFSRSGERLEIVDEALEYDTPHFGQSPTDFFLKRNSNPPMAMVHIAKFAGPPGDHLPLFATGPVQMPGPDQAFLSRSSDAVVFLGTGYVSQQFQQICLYRDWNLGWSAALRRPSRPDAVAESLLEDGSNLPNVINLLRSDPGIDTLLLEHLRKFNNRIEGIYISFTGGLAQLYLREHGLRSPIPAATLSDGTLRYLCLLSILYNPTPPPVICIEEPELGMHPDIIPIIAEMLIEASARTQLIVTTHSDLLISQFDDSPEAILVCEPHDQGTTLRRLSAEEGEEELSLGEKWLKGQIGGTRW